MFLLPGQRPTNTNDDSILAHETLRTLGESLREHKQGRVRIHNHAVAETRPPGRHIMRTTRMGRSRADSVVDRRSMVHDCNSFITGSSVLATGGSRRLGAPARVRRVLGAAATVAPASAAPWCAWVDVDEWMPTPDDAALAERQASQTPAGPGEP